MSQNDNITQKQGVYSLTRPLTESQIPLILDSPHSGRCYPADFKTQIAHDDLICGEDRFVDELFQNAPLYGASLLCAEFPRCYIDANRHHSDISPKFVARDEHTEIDDIFPFPLAPSDKSRSGIGLIREYFMNGKPLYNTPLSSQAIMDRITHYYTPYHDVLAAEIERLHDIFGFVIHIDCHSMPYDAAPFTQHSSQYNAHSPHRANIIIGDRHGATCDPQWQQATGALFTDQGFSVLYNQAFKGAEIVRRYGQPDQHRHSIQLEINRGLYLDKQGRDKSDGYNALAQNLDQIIEKLATHIRTML